MRILHVHNIAGVATTLAKYQSQSGDIAKVIVRDKHPFQYPGEILYPSGRTSGARVLRDVMGSEVVHYHSTTFFGVHNFVRLLSRADYRLSRIVSRPVFHFHGSELRKPEALVKSRLFFSERVIVATPDLLRYAPEGALFAPHPVDLARFQPNRNSESETMRVGYYRPVSNYVQRYSDPDFVEKTVTKLFPHAVPVGVERLPWIDMPDYFNSVHVWIDKFELGVYGVSACEAAACEIPVITQISEDVLPYLGDCPFINTTKDHLLDALEYLKDENVRKYLGKKCREYIFARHDAAKIVSSLKTFYLE